MGERGQLPSQFDLTALLPIGPGNHVGVVGSGSSVLDDLSRRSVNVRSIPSLESSTLTPASLDHLIVPELPKAPTTTLTRAMSVALRPGGRVLLGVRLGGAFHRQVAQSARSLRSGGFRSIQAYGAYPELPGSVILVSLEGSAAVNHFLLDFLIPYNGVAALVRRLATLVVAAGVKPRLFPSAVLTASRAA